MTTMTDKELFGNSEQLNDLISRQDAIDALDKIFPADPMRNDYTQGITCGAALATEYIKQLPSAQSEIIYCRECKYKMLDASGDEWICSHPSNNAWRITADHYCGYAERREE